jgi:ribosomal protein L12E/L44/L45/RPP1/RPP2
MIAQLLASQNRETIVAMLSQETVPLDTLRICACVALNGDVSTLQSLLGGEAPAAAAAAAPQAAAPAAAPATPKPKGKKRKPKDNGNGAPRVIDVVLDALTASGEGFAKSDVEAAVQAQGAKFSPGQYTREIAKRLEAGTLHQGGERRFAMYASTKKAADAASLAKRSSSGN